MNPKSCPHCEAELESSTCDGCGLWWVHGEREPVTTDRHRERVEVVFTEAPSLSQALFPTLYGSFGLIALVAGLWSLWQSPEDAISWVRAGAGLLVGGAVMWVGIAEATMPTIRYRRPGRILGEDDHCQVDLWQSWTGKRYLRTTTSIARTEIVGASITASWGDSWIVCVEHSSGLAFGTEGAFSRPKAVWLSTKIADWARSPNSDPPQPKKAGTDEAQ